MKVNDEVTWSSQAAGTTKTKAGTIVCVVRAGKTIPKGFQPSSFGWPRKHESYVVKAGSKLYWPRVSALKQVAITSEVLKEADEAMETVKENGRGVTIDEDAIAVALAKAEETEKLCGERGVVIDGRVHQPLDAQSTVEEQETDGVSVGDDVGEEPVSPEPIPGLATFVESRPDVAEVLKEAEQAVLAEAGLTPEPQPAPQPMPQPQPLPGKPHIQLPPPVIVSVDTAALDAKEDEILDKVEKRRLQKREASARFRAKKKAALAADQ